MIAVTLVVGFQLLFTYAPSMRDLFDTRVIGAWAWLRIVATTSSVFFVVEAEKWLARRLARGR